MGSQKMLVNVQDGETRIALTENDLLVDLHIEQTTNERTVGNIYCAVVVKVNPAFQAAFIEYGESRNGFLSVSDISPALLKAANGQRGRAKIQSVLKKGQKLMVQVLKEGMRTKGAAVTTAVSLPGRYLVMTTQSERSGVSRKIEDSEKRGKLKEIVANLMGDDDKGVIIRTAGYDRTPAELKRDFGLLQKKWKGIDAEFAKNKKPRLLYQEPKSLLRVLRDYFNENVEEVWVDSAEAYQEALRYFKATLPKFQKRLKLYVGDKSVFSAHRIEEQIAALDSSRVNLRSGGGIVIEPTEALVTIDVNSGRSNQASDIEATALATNLEAAEEVARQLRLRNLGGLVVIDFIDMVPAKNRERVERALAEAMANDKARISFGKISEFGLLELSRQRIDVELTRGSRMRCENCGGTGHVPTVNTSSSNVLRKIRELAASGDFAEIQGELPLEQANFLLNHRRESLHDLELEFDLHIHLTGNPTLPGAHLIRLVGERAVVEEDEEAPGQESREPSARDSEEVSVTEGAREDGAEALRPKRRRRRRGGRRPEGEEAIEEQQESAVAEAGSAGHHEQEAPEEEDHSSETEPEPEIEKPLARSAVREAPAASGSGNGQHGAGPPITNFRIASAAALGAPTILPAVFSAKRGGWLANLADDSISVGSTIFASTHQESEESLLPVVLPTFERSNPFIGMEFEESTTIFESFHRSGDAQQTPRAKPSAKKPSSKKAASRSGNKGAAAARKRGPAAASAASGKGRARKSTAAAGPEAD